MRKRMSVPLARRLAEEEYSPHAGLVIPAARTIVAQAERIEMLEGIVEGFDDFCGRCGNPL